MNDNPLRLFWYDNNKDSLLYMTQFSIEIDMLRIDHLMNSPVDWKGVRCNILTWIGPVLFF